MVLSLLLIRRQLDLIMVLRESLVQMVVEKVTLLKQFAG
nr:MAG TPA: hypothetical protein [Caudoviricetes sp.]